MAGEERNARTQLVGIRRLPRWLLRQARRRMAACSRSVETARLAALDLIYPAACAGCGAELAAEAAIVRDSLFCRECLDPLSLFSGEVCRKCGVPVPGDPQARREVRADCPRCRGPTLWFDETIAAGEYTGRLREFLLRMKMAEGNSLSLAMGQLIWQHCGERLAAVKADVVAPIPMHWRRRVAHGTNSAAVLAEALSARLSLPHASGLLRRGRHTQPQSVLPATRKWLNVRGAFAMRAGYHLDGAQVLLVDDILTTGAPCSAAARVLKRAGADRVTVTVAVVARWLSH